MVTYYVSPDCVAAILEKNEALCSNNLREVVSFCLKNAGCTPWPDIEAELYRHEDRWLLIARPQPPIRHRVSCDFPRLKR